MLKFNWNVTINEITYANWRKTVSAYPGALLSQFLNLTN